MKRKTKTKRYQKVAERGGRQTEEQLDFYSTRRKKRKSPEGVTTSDLIYTARVGTNAEVFPLVLGLHVPPGSVVADVTYGHGIFWKNIPNEKFKLLASDIKT